MTFYFTALFISFSSQANTAVSPLANNTAEYAVERYSNDMIDSLAELVTFNTVAIDGVKSTDNPVHIAFKAALKRQAEQLGLDYSDHGYVVIIGLGNSKERLGVITHGDIQPVDKSKWQKSPFELDKTSEPGKLIARGTEDDKGPISTALYAMKAIQDKGIKLNKRIELYVYMAEESDWGPLEEFIKHNSLPQTNITIDAEYPVVTAEKGWGLLKFAFEKKSIKEKTPYISNFKGGFFASQIPEDAKMVIKNATNDVVRTLRAVAQLDTEVDYKFDINSTELTITARGKSAHSSKPQEGINAITHLAKIAHVDGIKWPNNGAGSLVNFINANIGLGLEGKLFGNIAYSDDFMGPMTVSPTVIKQQEKSIDVHINIRRPRGKSKEQLLREVNAAFNQWQQEHQVAATQLEHYVGNPFIQDNAPQTQTLLDVFSHFTGIKDAKPIAIGGGTNSRLFPTAVSFGPSMPGKAYSGHSEHEFITVEQFKLNLKMYTAAFIELAK
ncbi:dipeptidase [Thalassotalea sp. M1531]|uniref:Dipeptidase n=1 Tax=Thalassotalea algicola TaxID=2716224 RepID=A0A7Y0Q6L5_9GAMM|nr:dipeptidase [Thalassotalea algicola]